MNMGAIQDMEDDIKECEIAVDTSKALGRLCKNRDFKKLFLDGYLKDWAIATVMKKAHPEYQTPELQDELEKQLLGVSYFSLYMDNIEELGKIKENAMKNTQFELDDYLEKGGE